MLLVDRLLTESTLEAAMHRLKPPEAAAVEVRCSSPHKDKVELGNDGLRKMVECRICQDEDEDANMESPCSCCGSLKYAHRRCIQRWCNEKGDTVCEICHQPFTPGYTAPPPLFRFRDIQMNFREITQRDLNNPRFIAMVSTNRDFLDPDYDEYAASTARSLVCCRMVSVIFMLLLILRHTLPLIIGGTQEHLFSLPKMLLFQTAGVILPIYIMLTVFSMIQQRWRRQEHPTMQLGLSGEETEEQTALQHQAHIIHIH